jgi:DNA polymerase III delta prime subunit
MENWIDKYKPKSSNEIVGNCHEILEIKTFLKQFDTEQIIGPNLLIEGPNGIGKTLTIRLILSEMGIINITPELSCIVAKKKSKKNSDVISTNNNSSGGKFNRTVVTYYASLSNKKRIFNSGYKMNKIALVIDDLSSITNAKEKHIIKALIKINNEKKKFPIILISGLKHNKAVTNIKKMLVYKVPVKKIIADTKNKPAIKNTRSTNSNNVSLPAASTHSKLPLTAVKSIPATTNKAQPILKNEKKTEKISRVIRFKNPYPDEIIKFMNMIVANEKIIFDEREFLNIENYIVDHCQKDIRRLINILEELKLTYGNKTIYYNDLLEYSEISKKKDLDLGIYYTTSKLLNEFDNIETSLSLYEHERTTIPLMVHENYPGNISRQYPNLNCITKIKMMHKITKSISESDKIDGLIYSNQCWNLQSVHGFYSCCLPSYYINKNDGKSKNNEIGEYIYTIDFNKTSIKNINNKVIKNAQKNKSLRIVSCYDFLYISHILKTLFSRDDLDKTCEFMKYYNLTPKEIDSIIKIDKINKTKKQLTNKQKNKIKSYLDDSESGSDSD